jgi:hypothetical protein
LTIFAILSQILATLIATFLILGPHCTKRLFLKNRVRAFLLIQLIGTDLHQMRHKSRKQFLSQSYKNTYRISFKLRTPSSKSSVKFFYHVKMTYLMYFHRIVSITIGHITSFAKSYEILWPVQLFNALWQRLFLYPLVWSQVRPLHLTFSLYTSLLKMFQWQNLLWWLNHGIFPIKSPEMVQSKN